LSRILGEAGELAKAANHLERVGSKVKRYGEGSKEEIAKESVDLI
jgi:NTP pyrophosphatase (non-canonical NTP hydrolase)